MTLKGGTSQACAACKHQRRKCTPECKLAPYFPPDQPKMFDNAHKLFGVSNIAKIIKDLDPTQRAEAMQTIIFQANMRDRFPVNGCCEIINRLYYQIQLVEEELRAVHSQLEICRQQNLHQLSTLTDKVTSQLEFGTVPCNNALPLFNHGTQSFEMSCLPATQNASHSSAYLDSKDMGTNTLWVQHSYNENTNNSKSNSTAIQSNLSATWPLVAHQEVVQDYDVAYPIFDTIDDRQSYIDSKAAYESSSEDSVKDTIQPTEKVAENELKSAAACFSLTSVN